MSSEVEISRNSAIPSSTSLPEVVLAGEEYDYGLNLISTMAATRENIVESSTVMNILSNSSIVGSKVIDVRDTNSPNSEVIEEEQERATEINDVVGVIISIMDDQNAPVIGGNTSDEEILVPTTENVTTTTTTNVESYPVEDTDTDDDVILVVQPIETIELLGDDDDEADVQIINTDEPIPKPKRLPQQQKLNKNQQPSSSSSSASSSNNNNNNTNNFPSIPRLPEPSIGGSTYTFSDDDHIAPLLKDLLNDHFGQLDFDLPLATNIHLTAESTDEITRTTFEKSFPTKSEIAIQTEEEPRTQLKDMETQTENSAFCGKRKLFYEDDECDGDECPICYEPWDKAGEHSLVSLKCGHLFGESCLRKWLNDPTQKQRVCPVCRARVEIKHIRTHYARRVRQINYDPEIKRLKLELEASKERAKKYEILYKREKEKEKLRNSLQGNVIHQRMPSSSSNLPPSAITLAPLVSSRQHHSPPQTMPIRTLSQVVTPHPNIPTTSRGHTSNPPPFSIYPAPLMSSRAHLPRSESMIHYFEEFVHDFSALPTSSANVMVDRGPMNH